MIERILQQYGIQPAAVLPVQKGYRNQSFAVRLHSGKMANLIVYKTEPGITRTIGQAHTTADALASQGFPVRQALDSRILRIKTSNGLKYAALYNYLPGRTIAWEAYTKAHIKLLGETLADMHNALKGMRHGLPHVAKQSLEITLRMQRYFNDPPVAAALQAKLGLAIQPNALGPMQRMLHACRSLPGQQPLHMDFVRGNVLFNDKPAITGILDFEKTALGHPTFDIARTLAFLLVDCKYKPSHKVRKYFLYSGYGKRRRLPVSWVKLTGALVNFYLLYDFYKFLRHNPYENLPQNEHFVRTRDILLKRRLIMAD